MSQLANNFDHMKEQIKERTQQLETQAIDLHKLLKNFDKHVIASRTNLKGILTYVSEAFCKINGFTKEELIGKPQSIGRHPDMPASFFENLWDTITEGKQWRGEIKNLTKDGDTYWVDVLISPDFDDDGKIIGYSAIRHDITAQKALQALSDSLEKTVQERTRELNKAQEIGKIGHWKIDLKDNSLTWSDEVYRIVGLHPQSMPQDYQSFLSFVHPDDKRKVNLTYWKSVRDNTPYYMKHRINQEGDGVRYVEEIGEHVTNEEGKVISSFGTIHDITELTLIQLELKEMNTRVNEAISKQKQQQKYLMQQSKMAAMGEMISMIAHQWRQPLSAISLTVTNLKVTLAIGDVDMESFENKLDNISTYVQHMSLTIDDFRNFFKPDKKPEEVKIDDIIDTTLELIKLGLMRHNISINKQIKSKSSLFTYKNELIQVLLNLFKNAQDNFVEKGTPQPKIDITVDEIDSEFTLVIHDNGGGIPEEYIEKIFEPYFSTKDEKNGTGLGLYMSKIIIDEHCHGSLIVKNEDGGAKFIIKLPTTVINYEI
jgi:PAS domain S-box-containing protein